MSHAAPSDALASDALAPDALPSPAAPSPSLEVAVYNVHAAQADAFTALQAAVHAVLSTLPGCLAADRLRGIDDPTLFADAVLWETHAAALHAADLLPTVPEAAPFLGAIATMRTFGHLPAAPSPGPAGAPAPATPPDAPV